MVQDSRSASYPGAAIASSYDFGSINFFYDFFQDTAGNNASGKRSAATTVRSRAVQRAAEGVPWPMSHPQSKSQIGAWLQAWGQPSLRPQFVDHELGEAIASARRAVASLARVLRSPSGANGMAAKYAGANSSTGSLSAMLVASQPERELGLCPTNHHVRFLTLPLRVLVLASTSKTSKC